MTPFDPIALVAMLQAFYPSVTLTSLQRAFRERPEYFAGGTLIGRHFDALRLPDGRTFDIVFSAWTSASRWQALDVTNAGPRDFEFFPLEEGPLVELDVDASIPPMSDPIFVPLVSAAIGDVYRQEQRLGDVETTVASGAGDVAIADGLGADLENAQWAHWQSARALEGENVGELVEKSDGLANQTDSERDELPAPPAGGPQDMPPYDPGPNPDPGPEQPGPPMPEP